MKNVLLVALVALVPSLTFGYSSPQGENPYVNPTIETKPVHKATLSAAIAVGDILSYDSVANDGFAVTQAGVNSIVGMNLVACVASQALATASTSISSTAAYVPDAPAPCITKGVARVKYDATLGAWIRGEKLCVNTVGAAVSCLSIASASSTITSLSTVVVGATGTSLLVLVNAK